MNIEHTITVGPEIALFLRDITCIVILLVVAWVVKTIFGIWGGD